MAHWMIERGGRHALAHRLPHAHVGVAAVTLPTRPLPHAQPDNTKD